MQRIPPPDPFVVSTLKGVHWAGWNTCRPSLHSCTPQHTWKTTATAVLFTKYTRKGNRWKSKSLHILRRFTLRELYRRWLSWKYTQAYIPSLFGAICIFAQWGAMWTIVHPSQEATAGRESGFAPFLPTSCRHSARSPLTLLQNGNRSLYGDLDLKHNSVSYLNLFYFVL